nr:cytoplasmic tRNA 2-thiolation protein 2 [Ipomoea batatas]
MACNTATCESGCYRDASGEVGEKEQQKRRLVTGNNGDKPGANSSESFGNRICVKCKLNETITASGGGGGGLRGDGERFCADCFRSNLYGKFRFSVSSNAMISPSDNVLVAFSGGQSSRVALHFVSEMQDKAQKNFEASRDRALPVFGVGVAFVDERSISPVPCHEFDKAIEEMKLIVSNLAPPLKQFHVVPTESVYSLEPANGREQLKKLIDSVSDTTGKEDLLEHFRMLALQKTALENGYTKIVLGTCTSRIACHVLEATVKGQGYSLAADIQYVDARWEIPVVLPLRDCFAHEMSLLCCLDSLKTVELFNGLRSGINGLVSSFVKLLQEENPSRESTIVRTAGKLTPFHFNRIPEDNEYNGHTASQRRQKKYNIKTDNLIPQESFCPICNSPVKISDLTNLTRSEDVQTSMDLTGSCCSSCQFQILPGELSAMDYFHSLLPDPIIARAKDASSIHLSRLREQIEDCLLSDTEDGT